LSLVGAFKIKRDSRFQASTRLMVEWQVGVCRFSKARG
jgi:hypothetical protein